MEIVDPGFDFEREKLDLSSSFEFELQLKNRHQRPKLNLTEKKLNFFLVFWAIPIVHSGLQK